MNLFHWIFMVFGVLAGGIATFLWFLQYLRDAERYRWLRNQPASLMVDTEISRWLLRRPYDAQGMDSVVDAGMGKAHRASAQKGTND